MTQSIYIYPQDPFPNLNHVKFLIQNKQLNYLNAFVTKLERKRREIYGFDGESNQGGGNHQGNRYSDGYQKISSNFNSTPSRTIIQSNTSIPLNKNISNQNNNSLNHQTKFQNQHFALELGMNSRWNQKKSYYISHTHSTQNPTSNDGLSQNLSHSRFRETNLEISLYNLSQNWNQYVVSANWHSILLNIHNPQMINHILYNILNIHRKQDQNLVNSNTSQFHPTNPKNSTNSSNSISSTNSTRLESNNIQFKQQQQQHQQDSNDDESKIVNKDRKKYFWLFDNLEHLIQLFACGCESNSCIGIVKSMPQLIYGMHLGVHHWIFDSIHTLQKLIQGYKSQMISIKDHLKPLLRITIHLENKYQQFGMNVKYQEKEIRDTLQICHTHGLNLFGVIMDLSPEEESLKNHKNTKSTSISQMRRGFRYLEIVCEECERANVGKPIMVFVRHVGTPVPDDMYSIHCESARYSMNQSIWDALQIATGKTSHQNVDIDSWLQPLQELTQLSKQWKDPEHRILLVADPTQFLLCNTHSLSVEIKSVSKKELPKPKKVLFYGSQQAASSDFQSFKSKSKYTHYQEIHLSESVSFLFMLKIRGIYFRPFVEKHISKVLLTSDSHDTSIDKLPLGIQTQQIELVPTIIYGESCHYDSLDCLNPLASPTKADEPIFFALPTLNEFDKIRFEGLGAYEHLISKQLLDFREQKYSTLFIQNTKSKL